MWSADLSGGLALVFGAEEWVSARSCAVPATAWSRSRSPARWSRSTSASRRHSFSTRRAGGGRSGAAMAEPTSTSSTGTTCSTRARGGSRGGLVDELASFVALKGARGVLVFDGVGEDAEIGLLSVRFAPHADALLERLAAANRATEVVCLVSSDAAVRGTSGQEVQKRSSRRSSPTCRPPRASRRAAPVSPTRSTPRRALGSSGSGAATPELDPNIRS